MTIKLSGSPLRLLRPNTEAEEAQFRVARDREISTARGVNDLTTAFAQIANVGARYQEQERLNYVNKSKLSGHEEMLQARDEWEQGLSGENAMESVAALKQRLGDIGTKLLETAPDDKSREVAGMQLNMLASGIMREAGQKAHKTHVEYSAGMVDQALNDTRKSAYLSALSGGSPADLTGYLDAVDTTMDAQAKAGYWVDPVTAEKLKRRAKSDISKGFVKGGLDSDQDGVVLRTIGDLQGGRYNALDFDDLLVLGHSAAAAKDRIKAKREAAAREAKANAEEAAVSKVYAAALSITGQGERQDPGAAAALLFSPTAKELFKGIPDKVLSRAAHWANSSWQVQKGVEAERQKDLEDAATDAFEGLRLRGELTHDKIEVNPAIPAKVRKDWHDILDRDAERVATKTEKAGNEQSKSLAASLLSQVAAGEITRVSEISPFRAKGLQDDEFNTVVKHLETTRDAKNKPWVEMADSYLKTVTKSKQNEAGILEPADVVRVHSILQEELGAGKLEAKDILRRTQELTDVAYTGNFWTFGDRDVRRFEVEPGGQLPATAEGRKTRDDAVDIIRKNDPALYNRLYGGDSTPAPAAAPAQQPTPAAASTADVVPETARALIEAELTRAGKGDQAKNPDTIRRVYEANKDKFKDIK